MTPDLLQVALDETDNSKRMAERLNLEIRTDKIQTNGVFDFIRVPIITVERNLLLPPIVNGDKNKSRLGTVDPGWFYAERQKTGVVEVLRHDPFDSTFLSFKLF